MRAVENGHARGIELEMTPVRVGFGHVAPEDEMIFFLLNEHREVGGEGGVVRGRDEDREWIRMHECDGISVVMHTEMFGNVHVVFFCPSGLVQPLAAFSPRLTLWAAFFRRSAAASNGPQS